MERIRTSRARVLFGVVVFALVVAACSSGENDSATSDDSSGRSSAEVAASGDGVAEGGADTAAGPGSGSGSGDTVTDLDIDLAGAEIDRKIVYRGDVASEVDDVASAVRAARDEVAAEGGYVFGQEISGDTARVVLKVPSIRFDAAFDAVTGIGTVTSQSIEADDVTEQFTDLASRRSTLEASIVRLRGFLDAAASADEVSRLESEVTRREAERDVIAGQLRVLEDRTTFGTISATFTTPAEAETIAAEEDDAGLPGFTRGLEVGVSGVVVIASVAATASGFALPFLPLVFALGALIVWQRRRGDRPSPA